MDWVAHMQNRNVLRTERPFRRFFFATTRLVILVACALAALSQGAASGISWRLLGFEGEGITALVMDQEKPSTLFVATESNRIFKSTDGGVTWKSAENVYANTLAIDPTNSSMVYASWGAYQGKTYKSQDGGQTWQVISDASTLLAYHGLTSIVIDPSAPSIVYGVTPGYLLKSIDGGKSWNRIRDSDSGLSSLLIHPADTSTLYLGDHNADVDKSTDGGITWSILGVIYNEPYDVRPLVMDPTNPQILYARVANGIFKSTNGGQQWIDISEGLPLPPYGQYTSLAIDPSNPSVVYAGLADGAYRSPDAGANWSMLGAGFPGSTRHIVVDPKNPSAVYAAGQGLWVTHQEAQPLAVPQIVACRNQSVNGKMDGSIASRKDENHPGEFQVTVSVSCDNGKTNVFNLEIDPAKLTDTAVKGRVHATELDQLTSLGSAAAPTVFLSGPCKARDDDIEGCRLWLMLVDNRGGGTPDIVSFIVADGRGKRLRLWHRIGHYRRRDHRRQ